MIGNFNPAIFSPAWFALNGLVSAPEADAARLTLIHSDMCQFEIGHFVIQSDTQHFSIACPWQYREMLRDLLVSTFGKFLRHTPVRGIGINRDLHFDTTDFRIRNAVGEYLAPKHVWGEWEKMLQKSEPTPTFSHGLLSLVMREMLDEDFRGHVQANIQPSQLPALLQKGIFIQINCHFEWLEDQRSASVDVLLAVLDQKWDFAADRSSLIVDHIQSLAKRFRIELGDKL